MFQSLVRLNKGGPKKKKQAFKQCPALICNKKNDWSHPKKILFSCKKDQRIKVTYNPRFPNMQVREVYNPPVFLLFSTLQWLLHLPGRYSRCPTHALPGHGYYSKAYFFFLGPPLLRLIMDKNFKGLDVWCDVYHFFVIQILQNACHVILL